MSTQIYLGCNLSERPIYLQFYRAWFPSLLILGSPGSWKSLSAARSLIETLMADGWTCIYVTITADWMGIQYPNLNPMDLETLKFFHSEWFLNEAGWKTHGISRDRITLLLSPFWRGDLKEIESIYGLKTLRWSIPVWNVMCEAVQDFYGGEQMLQAEYFKDLRELWEDLRAKKTNKDDFVKALEERVEHMPRESQIWAVKFVSKVKEWFEMPVDPILTDENILDGLLSKPGRLVLFHFPQEEITGVESATLATFIYTVMDVCYKYYRRDGMKYCVIIEDYGTWHHHSRSRQATEALIQRKGRKMGIFRVIIGQTEEDLKNSTIYDSMEKHEATFDFRIDATINTGEISGIRCLRGSVMYLHLRKHIHGLHGVRTFKPLLFVSRPPLTSYQQKREQNGG